MNSYLNQIEIDHRKFVASSLLGEIRDASGNGDALVRDPFVMAVVSEYINVGGSGRSLAINLIATLANAKRELEEALLRHYQQCTCRIVAKIGSDQ